MLKAKFFPLLLVGLVLAGLLAACGDSDLGSVSASPTSAANVTTNPTTTTAAGSSKYNFSGVTQSIKDNLAQTDLPGASLLVVKDGQTIYQQTFGSYTLDTQVQIASASKWYTAATIMTVVDSGKLKLDDPASKFIPSFSGDKAAITLRQLMSHTSGLPSKVACLGNFRLTLEECVNQIAAVKLDYPPGKGFHYGGVSLQVAARMAEVASGQSWAQLFKSKIADPLGMRNTRYGLLPDNKNPQVAGGALSTLGDYGSFLKMLMSEGTFNGQRVLSADSVRAMQHDQTGGVPVKLASPQRFSDGSRYGLGEWVDTADTNGQGIIISSPGAFGFTPWLDHTNNYYAVFLIDDKGNDGDKIKVGGPNLRRQVQSVIEGKVTSNK